MSRSSWESSGILSSPRILASGRICKDSLSVIAISRYPRLPALELVGHPNQQAARPLAPLTADRSGSADFIGTSQAGPNSIRAPFPSSRSHSLAIPSPSDFGLSCFQNASHGSLSPRSLNCCPRTRSAGTPIAPQIAVDNFSWSVTVGEVTSFLITPGPDGGRVLK